ncbi:hypothetical protein JCM21900_004998 [Sporobolomyces salmonicolor]
MSTGYDSSTATKRRRIGTADLDYAYVANPTTSRTKQAASQRAQAEAARAAAAAAQGNPQTPDKPILSFASLPPTALQRYLVRYGLLEPQGSLSYHHAVFPVPPLPATLHPPLDGRALDFCRAKQTYDPARRASRRNARVAAAGGEQPPARGEGGPMQQQDAGWAPAAGGDGPWQRRWHEPKTGEFARLTAFDDPQKVVDRLAKRAATHWEKRDSVKEGETLTNFMFSVRMRGHTLRATPPGSF